MRQYILFIAAISFALAPTIFFVSSCTDDDAPVEKPVTTTQVLSLEDFLNIVWGRDGVKAPFAFTGAMTIIDPFTPGVPQIAINQSLLDSVTVTKLSNTGVNYQNQFWYYYHSTYYFQDSTANFEIKCYYNQSNGDQNTIYPNVANNQLSPSNTNSWIEITRKSKSQDYFDLYCGRTKKLVEHHITTQNYDADILVQSNRCNSNLYSFQYF